MKSGFSEMQRASESAMMFAPDNIAFEDRKLFVKNLGWLLAQTREQVVGCELDDNEIVTITFIGGGTRKVNVNLDSYTAIVRDVSKAL